MNRKIAWHGLLSLLSMYTWWHAGSGSSWRSKQGTYAWSWFDSCVNLSLGSESRSCCRCCPFIPKHALWLLIFHRRWVWGRSICFCSGSFPCGLCVSFSWTNWFATRACTSKPFCRSLLAHSNLLNGLSLNIAWLCRAKLRALSDLHFLLVSLSIARQMRVLDRVHHFLYF